VEISVLITLDSVKCNTSVQGTFSALVVDRADSLLDLMSVRANFCDWNWFEKSIYRLAESPL